MAWKAWFLDEDDLWISRLESVDGEMESSLEWLADNNVPRSVWLATTLAPYWGRADRLRAHEDYLLPADDSRTRMGDVQRAWALMALAMAYLSTTSPANGRAHGYAVKAESLMKQAGDLVGVGRARRTVAVQEWMLGHHAMAQKTTREARILSEQAGDKVGAALAQLQIARYGVRDTLPHAGRPEAMKEAVEAIRLFRALGNEWGETEAVDIIQTEAGRLPRLPGMDRYLQIAYDASRMETHDANVETRRRSWICLSQIGLRQGDNNLLAESLLGLRSSDTRSEDLVRTGRRMGACLAHCSRIPGYRELLADWEKTRREISSWSRSIFERGIEEGKRIPLATAIKQWDNL
jgi:hypothetical protein